jgi:hypothetical protein
MVRIPPQRDAEERTAVGKNPVKTLLNPLLFSAQSISRFSTEKSVCKKTQRIHSIFADSSTKKNQRSLQKFEVITNLLLPDFAWRFSAVYL